MSAPSRSPFNLNDPSAYAPRQTRERLAAERISRESDPLRAPHAQNLVLGGDETELRPPHAPKRSEHQNELIDEHDLDRLLTSLRWLPQRLADKRRADEPQSPSALTRCATAVCHPATKEVDFQSLPIPEPQRMGLPPPGARQSHRIWLLPTLIAIGITAPTLYYFSAKSGTLALEAARQPRLVGLKERYEAEQMGRHEAGPIGSRDEPGPAVPPSPSFRQTSAVTAGATSAAKTVTLPRQDAIGAKSPPASNPITRVLDPEEIELLVKQGEQFVIAGDLAAARTALKRAAEAGDATAAVALGSTYDPALLQKLGVLGMESDAEKARSWYKKAEILGSAEATQRLRVLVSH